MSCRIFCPWPRSLLTFYLPLLLLLHDDSRTHFVHPFSHRLAFAHNKTPSEAAEELCELALKLGSSDNVTLVIVKFHWT